MVREDCQNERFSLEIWRDFDEDVDYIPQPFSQLSRNNDNSF